MAKAAPCAPFEVQCSVFQCSVFDVTFAAKLYVALVLRRAALQTGELGSVRFDKSSAEFPTEVVLRDFEQEPVPAGMERDIDLVGAWR